MQALRANAPVEPSAAILQSRMSRFMRMVEGWKSIEQYKEALKYLNNEIQPALDDVSKAIEREIRE